MNRLKQFIRNRNDKRVFTFVLVITSLFMLSPVLQIIVRSFGVDSLYLKTLSSTGLLLDGVFNTIELVLKVGILSSFIGFVLAYFMTMYHIKYKKIVNVLLIIPLAIPVYVAAYTYSNIFYQIPFLEAILRSEFLMDGAVFIYVLFLYPYVYIASKSYLSKNLTEYVESSSTLGLTGFQIFYKIILPLSRPVIIGSVLFVLFETLSDFAVVEYYGELTLSRYINIAWFNQGDVATASRLAIYILFLMFLLIVGERMQRRNKKFTDARTVRKPITPYQVNGFEKVGQLLFISVIILLGTILPIGSMLRSAYHNRNYIERLDLFEILFNTLLISSIAIVIIIVLAILLSTIVNYLKGVKKQVLSSLMVIGYSIPSMVLALGVYLLYIQIDKNFYPLFDSMILTSSIFIIVIGFVLKFFSIGYSNLMSAYQKIDTELLESAEILGENKLMTLFRVNIPLLRKSISAIAIILCIDMVKELTIVYSLRPFNFKTLSTEVYRYAGNEMIEVAAFPSLVIILICTILVVLLEGGVKFVKNRKS